MSNFEVGDRVVVVIDQIGRDYWTCRRGSVVSLSEGLFSARVEFDGGGMASFNQNELELEGVYDALSAKPVEGFSFDAVKVDSSDDEGDVINHPSHYADGWSNGAEVIDITENLINNRGNAVKYLARAGKKGGPEKELEDLLKSKWYVERELRRLGWSGE